MTNEHQSSSGGKYLLPLARFQKTLKSMLGIARYLWWLFFGVVGIIAYQVTQRYIFSSPRSYFDEISVFVGMLAAFLGTGVLVRERGQINLPLLYVRLKERWQRIAEAMQYILQILAAIIVLAGLWVYMVTAKRISSYYFSTLETPVWIMGIPVAIGMIMFILAALTNLFEVIFGSTLDK